MEAYIKLIHGDDLCSESRESPYHSAMYPINLLCWLFPALSLIEITTATPISYLDRSIDDARAQDFAAPPIASLSPPIQRRTSFTKRSVPWTALGEGWLGSTIDFLPILPSHVAVVALNRLYTVVAERCLSGMLQSSRTPTNSLVLQIGALKFIAEATDTMDWDVIYQFALKMREMVDRDMAPMYTMMFAHVAGQAVMFSIRIAGIEGAPIE